MIFDKASVLIRDKNKRNFFIYGVGQAFNLLSPLVIAPYIILVCGTEGFGKIGLGFAMALFLILIVDYAFEIKGIKSVAENRNRPEVLQKILNTTIATKLTLFFAALIVASLVIFTVPFFSNEKPLFFCSMTIVLAQVFNTVWFLQGLERFVLASFLNIGSKTLYVLLVLTLIKLPDDYIWVNLFLGISTLMFNLTVLAIIIFQNGINYQKTLISEILAILKNDFAFCMSQLTLSVRQLSPLFLVSYFLGFHTAGLYKILEQILTFFRTFIQVFLKFFFPRACYKFLGDISGGMIYWKKYSLLNLIMVAAGVAIVLIFTNEILLFFNVSTRTAAMLKPVFQLSLIISLLMSISLPLEQLMFLINKNKIYIRITIFVTVINVAIILLTIKNQELYGILISLGVAELLFISFYAINANNPKRL